MDRVLHFTGRSHQLEKLPGTDHQFYEDSSKTHHVWLTVDHSRVASVKAVASRLGCVLQSGSDYSHRGLNRTVAAGPQRQYKLRGHKV